MFARHFASGVLVLPVLAFDPTAVEAEVYGYSRLREIRLPYVEAGVSPPVQLNGTSYRMGHCVPQNPHVAWLKRPKGQFYKPERIVVAKVPSKFDLGNYRVVNGIVLQSLLYAWKKCQAWQEYGRYYEFGEVEVRVVQNGQTIVQTEASVRRGDVVEVPRIWNAVAEQRKLVIQKQRAAEQAAVSARKAQAWNDFWSTVWNVVKLVFFAVVALLASRYLPPVFTRIKWFFAPHPAIQTLSAATRHDVNEFVDGKLLADALNFKPANDTEAELARRDINWLRERVNEKHQRLKEAEELMRDVRDMEHAKKRVELLKRYGGKRG